MLKVEIKGVVIEIRTDFFLVVTFMLLMCESATVLISLFSSLFHECGHLAALIIKKEKPLRLVFSASGLRIDRRRGSFLSFGDEIFVALSGVCVNFFAASVSYAVYALIGSRLFFSVFCVNIAIAVFNLLPIESLDGAVGLHFFLCRCMPDEKVKRILNIVSVVTGVFLAVFFAVSFFSGNANPSLMIVIIYLIILLINRILELKKDKI